MNPPPCLCTGKPVHRRGGGALAYWIFDDGSYVKSQGAIILSTAGFSLEKVKFLASVLNNKWNFNCTINKNGDGFRTPAGQDPRARRCTQSARAE